jgi:hypothetical protein
MGWVGVVAERFTERSAGLLATLCVAIVDMILLFDRRADGFLGMKSPADATAQRLGGMPSGRSQSLKSDTADARHITPSTANRELVIVGAVRVAGAGNPVMRPAEYKPQEPVYDAVQSGGGDSVDAGEVGKQGSSLGSTPRKLKRRGVPSDSRYSRGQR